MLEGSLVTIAVLAGFVLAAIILLVIVLKKIVRVPQPDEAFLVSGVGVKSVNPDVPAFNVVSGGKVYDIPFRKINRMGLGNRKLTMTVTCPTKEKIEVTIHAVAIIKVGNDRDSIRNAAIRFLGHEDRMREDIQEVFEGFLRQIVADLDLEELLGKREELAEKSRVTVANQSGRFGLVVEIVQIKEITDNNGVIRDLGRAAAARIKTAAEIAEADRLREASVKKAEAAALTAEAERESAVKQAGYQAEIDEAKAKAAQAGPLAEALARQQVVQTETETARLEASRTEQQLETTVRKPADASAYARTKAAEADKAAAIAAAEAAARQTELAGAADASAIQARGAAEASAIQAKGLAEAAGIKARAEALAENQEAVLAQQAIEQLPQIAAAVSAPLANVTNMTVTTDDMLGMVTQGLTQVGPLVQVAKTMFSANANGNGHSSNQDEEPRPGSLHVGEADRAEPALTGAPTE